MRSRQDKPNKTILFPPQFACMRTLRITGKVYYHHQFTGYIRPRRCRRCGEPDTGAHS